MNNFLVLSAFFAAVITITAGERCGLNWADVIDNYHRSILTSLKMDCIDISTATKNGKNYCTLTSTLSKIGYRRSTANRGEIDTLLQKLGLEKMKELQPRSYGCELLYGSRPMFAGNHMNTYTLRCAYKKGKASMSCP